MRYIPVIFTYFDMKIYGSCRISDINNLFTASRNIKKYIQYNNPAYFSSIPLEKYIEYKIRAETADLLRINSYSIYFLSPWEKTYRGISSFEY